MEFDVCERLGVGGGGGEGGAVVERVQPGCCLFYSAWRL